MEIFLPICLILAGLFSIVCAVKDYDWFMKNRKARPIVAIFGRNGAKIFYIILGAFIILMGILAM